MTKYAYFNNAIVPIEQAKISVMTILVYLVSLFA